MSDDVILDSPATNVYPFDTHIGKPSHAIVRLPSSPGSHPTSSEPPSYTLRPIDADIHLSQGSFRMVEDDGQSIYFVAKLDRRVLSSQGFVNAFDACIRRARRQFMEMEQLVWQLEAALMEEGRSSESDYEADVDEPEDEAIADSGYESDDEEIVKLCGVTTHHPPAPYVDDDSGCAPKSEGEWGLMDSAGSTSLSSDSSDELVTFDPPSTSVSSAEELAPSLTSATHLYSPIHIPSPSVSTYPSDEYSVIENHSTPKGDCPPLSIPQLESAHGDDSLVLKALPDRLGPGCPPIKEQPICPACYGEPIRLVWGDESSDEEPSDLVGDLLGECESQLGELGAGQLPATVDGHVPFPIIAAEWSLSQALASIGTSGEIKSKGKVREKGKARAKGKAKGKGKAKVKGKGKGVSGVASTSSVKNLFPENQEDRAELGSESEEEPLAETIKRRREKGKAPASDESIDIPLSALLSKRVKKQRPRLLRAEGRLHPPASASASSNAAVQQEQGPSPRRRKRRREDDLEKEEGEISEYASDSGSEPDIPLAEVLAARRRSQSTLGHGPPPAKRRRCIHHVEEAEQQRRVSSREVRTPRRSWVHRRWEERLRLRHARGAREGRRSIRIMSTDEELIRRGMRAAERAAERGEERHYGSM